MLAMQQDACHFHRSNPVGAGVGRKPAWAVERDRERQAEGSAIWLFGLHAVRDALANPLRTRLRLVVTRNAADRLAPEIAAAEIEPEITDPRRFDVPLDSQSVHQGAAL